MKNITINTDVAKYDLLFDEYKNIATKSERCVFVWLKNDITHDITAGYSLSWNKGATIVKRHVLPKVKINSADLAAIMSGIKHYYPDSIGEIIGFSKAYMYEGHVNSMELKV